MIKKIRRNRFKFLKIILLIITLILFIGITIKIWPTLIKLHTLEGKIAFKEKIENNKVSEFFILFLIQFIQIFLAIIPGEPIEILAGMCYGKIGGTLFIMGTSCIISTCIYFLVRRYGRKFVEEFCHKEKVSKVVNSKLFQDPKKIEYIMMILFFLPGTPKDLLVYIGGLLPIKPTRFILISTIARIPSIISSTILGESALNGNIKIAVILYFSIFAVALLIILILNYFDKNKITKDAINTIK